MMAGIFESTQTRFLSLIKKKRFHAVFFINSDEFETADDIEQAVYILVWQALNLLKTYKEEPDTLHKKVSGVLIRPNLFALEQARENMLADSFACIMRKIHGHKDAILYLAHQRCKMTVTPTAGFKAEYYPFPIAMDATRLVYDDLESALRRRLKPITRAIRMTAEVGETHDETALRQWYAFASAAQEMAWCGMDRTTILNTAIYTSEDIYVRPIAYIAAEALKLEPESPGEITFKNPFADDEVNERLHMRTCSRISEEIISEALGRDDALVFYDEAVRQNEALMNGTSVGWCAGALADAAQAFLNFDLKQRSTPQVAQTIAQVFNESLERTPWQTLCKVDTFLMRKRRAGVKLTPKRTLSLLSKQKGMKPFAAAFLAAYKGRMTEKSRPE